MQNYSLTKTDAFDSITNFKENSESDWVACVQDLIAKRPFGDRKFYIFMFVKRVDDVSGIKKMYHQPRITKPEPQPGTTLLRVDPNNPSDATIIWTLPNQENFSLYQEGKMFADPFVYECIQKYLHHRKEMMQPEPGDPNNDEARHLVLGFLKNLKQETRKKRQSLPTSK